MKLSRLYTNRPRAFPLIQFKPGLNVVLADIRDPENLNKDTHNLGKTTLASVIDFCLLRRKEKSYFLFKHKKEFADFVFFLELELDAGDFLTVRRSVAEATKISFVSTPDSQENLNELPPESWGHWRLPFKRSKQLLDSKLNFAVAPAWPYRKSLGYALRLQEDYQDVFRLGKFRGAHSDWKPFLAELLGLDGQLMKVAYELADEIENAKRSIEEIEPQLVGVSSSPDKLEGMILLRSKEVEELSDKLRNFDFKEPDDKVSEALVEEVESSIAKLNNRRYHLRMALRSINRTLDETIKFELASVEQIFEDAGIYFGNQIKKDYSDLLDFLRSISTERAELLAKEKAEITSELEVIESDLEELNQRRLDSLAAIKEEKTLEKFRKYSERLVELKATLEVLARQREQMESILDLRRRLASLEQERMNAVRKIEKHLSEARKSASLYRRIRLDFGKIVQAVLDRSAVLSSELNKEGNVDFSAEIVDDSGTATSADMGHTYKKLLCIAFDISIFAAYRNEPFIHFVYHDGVFESLDDRKKRQLLKEIRKKCDSGLQQIITVIKSDLPIDGDGERMRFDDDEIVRILHDQGSEGRLFRMEPW